jgi:hypothetical protein
MFKNWIFQVFGFFKLFSQNCLDANKIHKRLVNKSDFQNINLFQCSNFLARATHLQVFEYLLIKALLDDLGMKKQRNRYSQRYLVYFMRKPTELFLRHTAIDTIQGSKFS